MGGWVGGWVYLMRSWAKGQEVPRLQPSEVL